MFDRLGRKRKGWVEIDVSKVEEIPARLARLRETLYPSDTTYCAEPIDIEDARFLLELVELLREPPDPERN